jgi:hypothetical protein
MYLIMLLLLCDSGGTWSFPDPGADDDNDNDDECGVGGAGYNRRFCNIVKERVLKFSMGVVWFCCFPVWPVYKSTI